MMFQFPFPPPPDMPLDPPGVVFQIFLCVLVPLLWFETILLFLPEKWRRKVSAWQFGARWGRRG